MANRVVISGVNTSTLPKLKNAEISELMREVKAGDEFARDKFVIANLRLVLSVVQRFSAHSEKADDMFQVGCVGLLKAIDNFDESLNVKFSTYAVPMISGEIKRYLRDDGSIKVSRSIKSLAIKIKTFIDKEKNKSGETPTIDEIAKFFEVEKEDVVIALDSCQQMVSLQAKIDEDDPNSQNVLDKLICQDKSDDMLDKLILKDEIASLPEKEKKIILLRYYRGKTQGEVAELLDISQVQVSRIESKIIEQLRNKLKQQ